MAMANVFTLWAWDAVGLKHTDYAEHQPRLKAPPRSLPTEAEAKAYARQCLHYLAPRRYKPSRRREAIVPFSGIRGA